MRVVIAPDSFKGSIDAASAARALAEGWRSVRPGDELVLLPMADGGEGTVDAFAASVAGAQRMPVTVTGSDDATTDAAWVLLPPTVDAPGGAGVVDLASTSGIELLGGRLRPWDAHTLGFGQAIRAALERGVSRLILGIGSSASTDGGMGMLTELGARFTDAAGDRCAPGARGLLGLKFADLTGALPVPTAGAVVLSDVTNPLVGPQGAAAVFGPQKGLDPSEIDVVDAGLGRLARLLGADVATPGAGAAGGVGAALLAWGAHLVAGADEVAELTGLVAAIDSANVVITGEGAFDAQSASGKVPAYVASAGRERGVTALLVAGRIALDADVSAFATTIALTDLAGSEAAAREHPSEWLVRAGELLARESSRS